MNEQYQQYPQNNQNNGERKSSNFVNPEYQSVNSVNDLNGGGNNYFNPNQGYQNPGQKFAQNQQNTYDYQGNANYNQNINSSQQVGYNTSYTSQPPVGNLKANRSLGKFILLSLVTLGIYSIIYYSSISTDINIIASRYDGKKTMHYCLMFFLLGPITLYIFGLIWFNNLSSRIGNELRRRGLNYDFGASDFWLWNVLGSLILVGPFIYIHKLSKAMNLLAQDYNYKG